MLKKLKNLMNGDPKTANEATDRMTQVEAELEQARATLADLEAGRESLLLTADDAAVLAHDDATRTARLRVDRLGAQSRHLEALAGELADSERKADARIKLGQARKAIEREKAMLREYESAAKTIASLIQETSQTRRTIAEARQAAEAAGIEAEEFQDVQPACHLLSTPARRIEAVTEKRWIDWGAKGFVQGPHGPPAKPSEEVVEIEPSRFVPGVSALDLARPVDDRSMIRLPAVLESDPPFVRPDGSRYQATTD